MLRRMVPIFILQEDYIVRLLYIFIYHVVSTFAKKNTVRKQVYENVHEYKNLRIYIYIYITYIEFYKR